MNIPAKKSLGQNFLHAPHIVGKMVHTARIDGDDMKGGVVLEVGPGKGVLTVGLLEKARPSGARVVAIEKDDRMIPFLQEKFADDLKNGTLTLIHGDILEFNDAEIMKMTNSAPYIVVANIPYYITGELLRKFLESDYQPLRMVLMVQKEVAKRLVDTKESILSISVRAFGSPKYVETVQARHFRPVPNVDSAVILIDSIGKTAHADLVKKIDKKAFFKAVKAGFAHKRKVLISNLEILAPREKLQSIWDNLNLDPKIRAETLPIDTWIKIVEALSK